MVAPSYGTAACQLRRMFSEATLPMAAPISVQHDAIAPLSQCIVTAHLGLRGGQVREFLHRAASCVLAGSAEDGQDLERPLCWGGHVQTPRTSGLTQRLQPALPIF